MPYYTAEYNQLAVAVAVLIGASCLYFATLLSFEIFFMMKPERAAWCVALCTPRSKREKMAKRVSGEEDNVKGTASGRGKESGEFHMQQSVLVSTAVTTHEGRASNANGVLDSEDPPSKLQWGVVRSHAQHLQSSVDDLREEVRKLRLMAHGDDLLRARPSEARIAPACSQPDRSACSPEPRLRRQCGGRC